MLIPRIIPCLLIYNNSLVKTVKFKDKKYVGDPVNAVKIFNEKQADELMIFDIGATPENKEPDYKMIANIAAECRMPMCYGGGIKTPDQARKIFSFGVEKIAISAAIIKSPKLITEIASEVGSQSLVGVIDVKKNTLGEYDIYTHNAQTKVTTPLLDVIAQFQELGVGEIVIQSIEQDGVMQGYDLNLISKIKPYISIPLTVLGGAGKLEDIDNLVKKYPIIGAAAGSLFVFKGKYKAVLINYPSYDAKEKLVNIHSCVSNFVA